MATGLHPVGRDGERTVGYSCTDPDQATRSHAYPPAYGHTGTTAYAYAEAGDYPYTDRMSVMPADGAGILADSGRDNELSGTGSVITFCGRYGVHRDREVRDEWGHTVPPSEG